MLRVCSFLATKKNKCLGDDEDDDKMQNRKMRNEKKKKKTDWNSN